MCDGEEGWAKYIVPSELSILGVLGYNEAMDRGTD